MEQIDVGVFDEHAIFAQGVAAVLRDDPAIGSVAIDPERTLHVDVGVVSLQMLRALDLECPAVVCVPERELAVANTGAAAAAVLVRESVTPDQLCGAVHAAAAGLRVEAMTTSVELLDERSRAILRMLAEGAGTREISERLGYSERTIKGAIQQAQRALGARSRAQAVALALKTAAI